MASESRSKINSILKRWPAGTVAVLPWLREQGLSQQLVHEYVRNGWLERIGHGAFVRSGQQPDWTGGLYALQTQLGLPIHAAAQTALQLQGYTHFVPMGANTEVCLFGAPATRLPAWFRDHDWQIRLDYVCTNLFEALDSESDNGLTRRSFGGWGTGGYGSGGYGRGGYGIALSSPERAMLEVCYRVPKTESYEDAHLLMEGLVSARPRFVQFLLQACGSIKAKRLFMHLAERCDHPWVAQVDLSGVDLGRGKRSLVAGGHLDPTYNIVVPREGE